MIASGDVILKRFEEPDEVRETPLGRFELITVGGPTIGRATYQPGWRWSEHVGPGLGQEPNRGRDAGDLPALPRSLGDYLCGQARATTSRPIWRRNGSSWPGLA